MLKIARNKASLTVTFPDNVSAQYWGRPHEKLSKEQVVGKLVDALVRAKVAEEVEKPKREKKKAAPKPVAAKGKQPMAAKKGAPKKSGAKKKTAAKPAPKPAAKPAAKKGKEPMAPSGDDTGIRDEDAA